MVTTYVFTAFHSQDDLKLQPLFNCVTVLSDIQKSVDQIGFTQNLYFDILHAPWVSEYKTQVALYSLL